MFIRIGSHLGTYEQGFYFQWYVNCINLLINLILPISIMAVLNFYICRALNQSQTLRRGATASEENLRKRDIRWHIFLKK